MPRKPHRTLVDRLGPIRVIGKRTLQKMRLGGTPKTRISQCDSLFKAVLGNKKVNVFRFTRVAQLMKGIAQIMFMGMHRCVFQKMHVLHLWPCVARTSWHKLGPKASRASVSTAP